MVSETGHGFGLFSNGWAAYLESKLLHELNKESSIPYALSTVSAGFPSPADDYIEHNLSLTDLLINNHLSTFLMKASGDSMIDVGINHDDILVVDRSLEAKNRDIIIAILEGSLTVKRLLIKNYKAKSSNFLVH